MPCMRMPSPSLHFPLLLSSGASNSVHVRLERSASLELSMIGSPKPLQPPIAGCRESSWCRKRVPGARRARPEGSSLREGSLVGRNCFCAASSSAGSNSGRNGAGAMMHLPSGAPHVAPPLAMAAVRHTALQSPNSQFGWQRGGNTQKSHRHPGGRLRAAHPQNRMLQPAMAATADHGPTAAKRQRRRSGGGNSGRRQSLSHHRLGSRRQHSGGWLLAGLPATE